MFNRRDSIVEIWSPHTLQNLQQVLESLKICISIPKWIWGCHIYAISQLPTHYSCKTFALPRDINQVGNFELSYATLG
jgi:hypothetical protein